ncbi:MAG: hypothetical protein NTY53_03690 [Kiritimatiellaeota bacterium]|nr:hypothetical protein [Kiritimatiellota bacterium]
MNVYTDWKPVDSISMFCPHCGFSGYTSFTLLPESERAETCDVQLEELVPLTPAQRQEHLKAFADCFGALAPKAAAAYLQEPEHAH